ncbi:hypothetical protein [Streptomyces sp. NPDC048242]|uniref:hypothetical protein n=1 Tax=Streptomyces sp. NPDC048242 TaxID=3155026 RepID=UPI003420E10B
MGLEYLQDPNFWVVQVIIGTVLMLSRFPLELFHWLTRRSVRRVEQRVKAFARSVGDDALHERIEEMVNDHLEAPRLLRFFYALMIIREGRRLLAADGPPSSPPQGGAGEDASAGTVPDATPPRQAAGPDGDPAADPSPVRPPAAGPPSTTAPVADPPTTVPPTVVPPTTLAPVAVAPVVDPPTAVPPTAVPPSPVSPSLVSPSPVPPVAVPPRRRRVDALVDAVCARLAILAGHIVGGEYAADYETEMAQDLAGARKRLVRLAYALSNVIGAFRLRLILRTIPFLQGLLAPREGRRRPGLLQLIDYIVASDLVCAGFTVVVDTVVLLFVRGWLGLTFVTWAALPLALLSAYVQSRARRAWRTLRPDDGTEEPT